MYNDTYSTNILVYILYLYNHKISYENSENYKLTERRSIEERK